MHTTPDERETIWRLRTKHGVAPKKIASIFPNIPRASIRRIISTYNRTLAEQPKNKETIEYTDEAINYTNENAVTFTTRIRTLEDLIDSADIDMGKWDIERWVANTWESAMKGADYLPIITTLYQVKAHLVPSDQHLVDCLIDEVREDIRRGYAEIIPVYTGSYPSDGRLLEISIPDMHFGKLALIKETSEEYNLAMAERLLLNAVNYLVDAATQGELLPEEILLPLGNDLFHVDNAYLTTFNGTPMESIHSVQQLFRHVKIMLRTMILELSKLCPVTIMMIPGNHDKTITYFLAEALEDMFWHNDRVTIVMDHKKRQYFNWGTNLIGFTHGDGIKKENLPMTMVNETGRLYHETTRHEWHMGHKHQPKQTTFQPLSTHKGVIVRELPSLSAADNWHYEHGFNITTRSAEAFLWHRDRGLIGTFNVDLAQIINSS